jgi:cbb3-type cytochrome oxidase subunit 1
MFSKKFIANFSVLLLPMLIVSALLNFLYSLNSKDYTQINWLIVVLLAIVLDTFITWIHTRKEREKNQNNFVN